jgi:alpha-ketoglutarate-dependent taurine dioxygenase
MGAVFSAHVVPKKDGQTGWADMRAAYDALDDDMKARIESLSAYHSLYYSQAKLGFAANKRDDFSSYGFFDQDPPLRPLVKVHPKTGRRVLLLGRHAHAIPGMSESESEDFIEQLSEFACQPPRIYHHNWTPGDVVLWDNRCLMHQARPWDLNEPRVMFHSRIAGEQPSEFAPSS